MLLENLLDKSCYGFTAHISEESLDKLDKFQPYLEAFLHNFQKVIIATNTNKDVPKDVIDQYHNKCRKIAPNCVILHSEVNRGHMFGTIDLDESIFRYVKENLPDHPYLWKSADDIIVSPDILVQEVEEAEFYYLPGFSYESLLRAGGKENLLHINRNEIFESGLWTPQTPFFILYVHAVPSLYGDDIERKIHAYEEAKKYKPYIKPWEIEFDIKFDCETHLGRSTRSLRKCNLVEEELEELMDFIMFNRVGDPSHKNIYFQRIGVCHYHYYNDLIYNI